MLVDLDGDGNLDIVAVNTISDDLTRLFGHGDGTFTSVPNTRVGDDEPDLAFPNQESENVVTLLGEGCATSAVPAPDGRTLASPADEIQLIASPNPFFGETTVRFRLPATDHVRLDVVDSSGRRIRELFSGRVEAGAHAVTWDGRNDRSRPVPSGTYWLELGLDHARSSTRLLILR
ncbi:MAG: hypothetical protein H6682_00490 [Candidatus Eisenbacteria bacterium]|nr:hypothetical protein [Candidatus Eisenbacteria bacterium]